MLDLGATSFWEDFDHTWMANTARIDEIALDGRRQFPLEIGRCSSGVAMSLCRLPGVMWRTPLSEHVLGIRPILPGCFTEADPHLCSLPRVEGTFPTPYGIVRVNHVQNEAGKVVTDIKGPKEIEIDS